MKLVTPINQRRRLLAFSLIEIMVALAILGVVATGFMAAFGTGFNLIKGTRLEQRATQVLLEKMEVIRVFNWDQIVTPGVIPTNFVEPFFTMGDETNTSISYRGNVSIAMPPVSNAYSNDLRLITIDLFWTNDNRVIHRSASTFVSRYGMQQYFF